MNVAIVRFCYGGFESSGVVNAVLAAQRPHPLVSNLTVGKVEQYGTHVARNKAVREARAVLGPGDVLVMLDHDMEPSLTFFAHAVEFLATHPGPHVIGSPYRQGRQDGGRVLVGRGDFAGERAEGRRDPRALADESGDERVDWVGTGYLACSMAAFDAIDKPYFDYEYHSPSKEELRTTEDMYFGRKLTAAGGGVWVAWDHWSGHLKKTVVGREG